MSESYRFPDDGEPAFVTLRYGTSVIGLGTYDRVPGLDGRELKPAQDGRGFELCIYVDDVDHLVTKLRSRGVRILVMPLDKPWGERVAYVADPEGNALMLTHKIRRWRS